VLKLKPLRSFVLLSGFLAAVSLLSTNSVRADQDQTPALIQDELSNTPAAADEAPKEYPFPGAKEDGFEIKSDSSKEPLVKERPVQIDDDGNYIYSTEPEKPAYKGEAGGERPKRILKNGEYNYNTELKKPKFQNQRGAEKPIEINKQGEYYYLTEKTKPTGAAGFTFGLTTAPVLENDDTHVTFKKMYSANYVPTVLFNREWKLNSSFGHLGLKFVSGVFTSSGIGVFKSNDPRRRPDDQAQEQFTFIMFPNHLTGIYKFQYSDTQILVPYVEAGPGYFTFAEIRNDSIAPKLGGTPVVVAAGGLNILMDSLDRKAIQRLDSDYGVSHIWLDLDARQVVGLNKNFDFTSSIFTLGFSVEY
jgi:hypothetical protein